MSNDLGLGFRSGVQVEGSGLGVQVGFGCKVWA